MSFGMGRITPISPPRVNGISSLSGSTGHLGLISKLTYPHVGSLYLRFVFPRYLESENYLVALAAELSKLRGEVWIQPSHGGWRQFHPETGLRCENSFRGALTPILYEPLMQEKDESAHSGLLHGGFFRGAGRLDFRPFRGATIFMLVIGANCEKLFASGFRTRAADINLGCPPK